MVITRQLLLIKKYNGYNLSFINAQWKRISQRTDYLLVIGLLLYFFLAYTLPSEYWWLGCLTIALCHFFPKRRLEILSVISFAFGLFLTNTFFSLAHFGNIETDVFTLTKTNYSSIRYSENLYKFVSLILYFLFLISLRLIYAKFFKKFSIISICFVLLIYSLILYSCLKIAPFLNTELLFLLELFLLILLKHVWYALLLIRTHNFAAQKFDLNFVASSLLPFWTITGEPRETYSIENYFASPIERLVCYQRGVRALFEAFVYLQIAMAIYLVVHFLILKKLPDLQKIDSIQTFYNYSFRNVGRFSLLVSWILVVTKGITSLLLTSYVYGQTFVGLARMCGVDLTDAVNKPWKSETFYEFISRSMYYYNQTLESNFIFPLLDLFKKLKIFQRFRKLFIGISVFIAIIVGGLIFHILRDPVNILKLGFLGAVDLYIQRSFLYFLILAIAIVFSILIEKGYRYTTTSINKRVLKIGIYLFIYSLIYLCYYVFDIKLLYKLYCYLFGF